MKRKLKNYDNSFIPLPERVGKVLIIPLNFTIQLKEQIMMHKTTFILFLSMLFLHSNQIVGQEFITTWEVLADDTITIPTAPGSSYDYTIDWGDLKMDFNVMGDTSHTYVNAGVYTVKISGTFPRIYFNNSGDKDKIKSIEKWGLIEWTSMDSAFYGCSNLQLIAEDTPDFSNVTSLNSMFRSCTQFTGNSYMKNWDTSTITDMSWMFQFARNFNDNIRTWNTHNVTSMQAMFSSAREFNQDIGNWNTSNVLNMSYMFSSAQDFDQDISYKPSNGAWNTANVVDMSWMFQGAYTFNQNIGNWNTSMVTDMSLMFHEATNFQKDISYKINSGAWHTGKVTDMGGMFCLAYQFNHDIGNWKTNNVNNMRAMFWGATSFNQDIGQWNTSKVINMGHMFHGAIDFNKDISYKSLTGAWNTEKVKEMDHMFRNAFSFNQDIGNWNIDSLDNIYSMLYGALSFDQDLSNWDFSPIFDMRNFLEFSGLSILNYDRLLQSWVDQDLSNKDLGAADGVQYCNVTAHDKLISELGWTITDDVIGSPASSNWTHLNANWYDNETHWSDMAFPTLCTDVLIPDTKNINIQVGQKAMAATLEVELGAVLDIPLGAELIVDPQ